MINNPILRKLRKEGYFDDNPLPYCREELTEKERNSWRGFKWGIIYLAIILLALVIFSPKCHAYTLSEEVLAVIGEAEGEPPQGQEAVACALNNRGTLYGVYGLRAKRVVHHLYSQSTYNNAWVAVYMAQDVGYCEQLIHGAQFWGSTIYDEHWIKTMQKQGYVHTATIGNQSFYRKDY